MIPSANSSSFTNPPQPKIIAILREQKVPAERRAPFSPKQVAELLSRRPYVQLWVQPSADRCFSDDEYAAAGAILKEDVSEADYLLGIKERKPETLLAGKHYLAFSHTIKEQPANRLFLQTAIQKGCTVTDYETITDDNGSRLVAFGYFAGVVGALHALRMAGIRTSRYDMQAPKDYDSLELALKDLDGADLDGLRFVLTGHGRVSAGAAQVLVGAGFSKISVADFLAGKGTGPVYCQLSSADLYAPTDGTGWKDTAHFYHHPEDYTSRFAPFIEAADVLITGAFWGPGYPRLFDTHELASPNARLRMIADVSCDILGAVPCTLRPSSIDNPYFDIDPTTGHELPAFSGAHMVSMMTIDNLPCEMPAEATRHFGRQFLDEFLDDLLTLGPITQRATLLQNGQLTANYQYLAGYAAQEEEEVSVE